MKHLIFYTLLSFSLFSHASEPELIVRADINKPKHLPVWSKMPSTPPSCNNNGMAIKFSSLFGDERLHPAVSLFQGELKSLSKPFESDLSISDLFFTNDQSVVFSLNYRGGTEGIFELDAQNNLTQITFPKNFPDVIAMSRPSVINDKVLYRALNKDGLHTIYHGSQKILEEAQDIAYLYLPTVKQNQIVLKVGLGAPGEVNQKNADKIISIVNGVEKLIATDQDLNPESNFLSFDNSPIPDGEGGVAFIAKHKVHGRSLWLHKNNYKTLIFKSSQENGSLEYFSPAVNLSGDLVFRVIKNKIRSVMVWNSKKQKLKTLLKQGQNVFANEENIKIIDRDKWPAFSARPCITNNRNVYIHIVLESSKTLENKGSGVFKIKL